MTQEQLKAFLEKVKGDTSLQEKLKAAKSQDDVVSIAKDHVHVFVTEHTSQLSEEELEGVDGSSLIVGIATAVIAGAAVDVGVAVMANKAGSGLPWN